MTSRERVNLSLKHKKTDRPPFDCTFTIDAYNRLVNHLNIHVKPKTKCSVFSTVKTDIEVIKAMKIDFAYVDFFNLKSSSQFTSDDEYTDEWGLIYRRIEQPNGFINYQVVNAPLQNMKVDDIEEYPWPKGYNDSVYTELEKETEYIYRTTELAIIGNFGGSLFTLASLLRGMENWYTDLLLNQQFVVKLLTILINHYLEVYKKSIRRIGKYLSLIRTDNDDYGIQNGLLISLETFRDLIKPLIRNYYKIIRNEFLIQNPHGKLMKHSCGDISELLFDFAEMGIDVIDPVQVTARGMNIVKLKKLFGKKLCFHGAIDTQHLLPFCTPNEVASEVERTVRILGSSGGYIVSPVHHVEGDIPPANLVAIRDQLAKMSL